MSSYTTRGAEGLDRRGFTLDEIERMLSAGILDPDEKFEVIDGEIVPMNAQNMPHMRMKALLVRALIRALPERFLVVPEATLIIRERPLTSFETDVLVVPMATAPKRFRAGDILLAIEVADTTRERDLTVKAPRYAAAGVAELWVVDLENRVTRVHRGPSAKGWHSAPDLPFDAPLSALFAPDIAIRIADLDPET